MRLSIDEFKSRPRAPRADIGESLRAVHQQAVRLAAVTGDPDWDYFLAYVESAVQSAERTRTQEETKLRDSRLVNDEAIRTIKISIAQLDARIGAFKEVLLLPKFLKEQGDKAKLRLAEMVAAQK